MRYIKGLLTTIVLGSALALASTAHSTGTCTDIAGCGGGSGSGGGAEATATAAAPTYSEGQTDAALSLDLAGNLRTTFGTLLSGEDQTNNLLQVSGGATRVTAFTPADQTTNATGTTIIIPRGSKTIQGTLVCNAGSSTNCTMDVVIWGGRVNSTATGNGEALCHFIIPTGVATSTGTCPTIDANFLYYWYVTSATAGTSPVLNISAMY